MLRLPAILSLFIYFASGAQLPEKQYIHYSTRDGLAGNFVTGIEQDARGYIWISTTNGLSRFDGSNFTTYQHTDNPNSLPENVIYSSRLLTDNELAVATNEGVHLRSCTNLSSRNLYIPSSEALHYWSNACNYVMRDVAGNYGVSTKTGFYIFSTDGRLKNRMDRYTDGDVGKAWMMFGSYLFQLPDGCLAQKNDYGFTVYDYQKNRFQDIRERYPLFKKIVPQLAKTPDKFFMIGRQKLLIMNTTQNSFEVYDLLNGSKKTFPSQIHLFPEVSWSTKLVRINDSTWAFNAREKGFYLLQTDAAFNTIKSTSKKYLPDYYCHVLFYDRDGRCWIGTNRGLLVENITNKMIFSFPAGNDELLIRNVALSGRYLFCGTYKGELLVVDRFLKKTIRTIKIGNTTDQPTAIFSFAVIDRDTLWAGTSKGVWWMNTKTFSTGPVFIDSMVSGNDVPILYRDSRNTIWMSAGDLNTIYKLELPNRHIERITRSNNPLLQINAANSFAEDKNGNIWIGGDAIVRYNYLKHKIDTLLQRLPGQRNRKKGFNVANDPAGNIWTTTGLDGFERIWGDTLLSIRQKNMQREQTVPVNPTMIHDKLFLGTTTGLGYYNTSTLQGFTFDQSDGLPEEEITGRQLVADEEGGVWFASRNVVSCLLTEGIHSIHTPSLIISELLINNDSLLNYPAENVRLNHDQNMIRIGLSAINFNDPANMRFAYRLNNGTDSNWTELGVQSNVLLTNIAPGQYKLEMKVYAFNNKWPEQVKRMILEIRAPFWRQPLFILLIFLSALGALYLFYRYRVSEIRRRANLDQKLAQTEMKALHAQMNPHFIFNCLNSIREMILNNENRQASRYLSKFAQLIRLTLDQSSKSFIALKETIVYLERYLEMEQIRTDRFTYDISYDEELEADEVMIPPMLIQPFIENAIWHGQKEKDTMHIAIHFYRDGRELACVINDTGIGIEASLQQKHFPGHHTSVGIENIRQRIGVLNEKYGTNCRLTIIDKKHHHHKESGTIVTLHLPIKKPVFAT